MPIGVLGVRRSPAAARSARTEAVEIFVRLTAVHVAAPGDGRSPGQRCALMRPSGVWATALRLALAAVVTL